MRLPAALAATLLALAAGPALSRAFTVEDLLATESVAAAALDPAGRWAIIGRTRPWAEGPRFDHGGRTAMALGRLDLAPLAPAGAVRPLFDQDPDAGYVLGPISPQGRWALVYRLQDHVFSAGIVEIATGQVRWLPGIPDQPVSGRAAAWRAEDQLLLVQRPDGDPPRQLAVGWTAAERLPRAWADQAAGTRPSVSVWTSGRALAREPLPSPGRLVSVDPATGAQRVLLGGEILDLEVSPGGRFAALFLNAERQQPKAADAVYPAFPNRRRSLVILDLATGKAREPCPGCDFHLRILAWSPAGDELLAARREGEIPQLFRMPATSGQVRPVDLGDRIPALAHTGELAPLVAAQWLGERSLVYAQPAVGGRADWYALQAGGPPRNLTAALPQPPGRGAWIAAGRLHVPAGGDLWTLTPEGTVQRRVIGAAPIAKASLGGGARLTAMPIAPPDLLRVRSPRGDQIETTGTPARRLGEIAAGDQVLAAQGAKALVLTREPNGVARLEVLGGGRPPAKVLTMNPALSDVTPARLVPVFHAGPKGEPLTSWLYLPPPRPDGRKPALVVIPYPGDVYPEPARSTLPGELRLTANPQVLVGAGYAVLTPSLPFDRQAGEPMAGLADQILAVVDTAIATGEVDGERLALFGHSFGGYTAMAAATQTGRFKAIIAMSGISDLVSYWGVMPIHAQVAPGQGDAFSNMAGLVERGHPHTGAPPWADPRRYVRNSPLFAAGKIRTPLLLIHGDQDEVTPNQSQEMFAALYRQGKDAQLAIYRGEGHAVISPANVPDLYARVLAFLAENLETPPRAGTAGAAPQAADAGAGVVGPP